MAKAPANDRAGVRQVIRALRKAGAVRIGYYDEDFGQWYSIAKKKENEMLDTIMNYDDVWVRFRKADRDAEGYDQVSVRFVFGNSPEEVVCDNTIFREDENSFSVLLDNLSMSWWDDEDDD